MCWRCTRCVCSVSDLLWSGVLNSLGQANNLFHLSLCHIVCVCVCVVMCDVSCELCPGSSSTVTGPSSHPTEDAGEDPLRWTGGVTAPTPENPGNGQPMRGGDNVPIPAHAARELLNRGVGKLCAVELGPGEAVLGVSVGLEEAVFVLLHTLHSASCCFPFHHRISSPGRPSRH